MNLFVCYNPGIKILVGFGRATLLPHRSFIAMFTLYITISMINRENPRKIPSLGKNPLANKAALVKDRDNKASLVLILDFL
jgi:hypothetical protein